MNVFIASSRGLSREKTASIIGAFIRHEALGYRLADDPFFLSSRWSFLVQRLGSRLCERETCESPNSTDEFLGIGESWRSNVNVINRDDDHRSTKRIFFRV